MLESLSQTLQGPQTQAEQHGLLLGNGAPGRPQDDDHDRSRGVHTIGSYVGCRSDVLRFTPTFGASAGDLLSDQVNLSHQIFNLRMILERSLSDRLIDNKPRTQAVLGFNVTIDPPKTAVDAVAEVEITLRADVSPGFRQLLAVVALPMADVHHRRELLHRHANRTRRQVLRPGRWTGPQVE